MIVAVIGSRSIKQVDIGKILPEGTTELISGGANGVDSLAAQYAAGHNLPIRVLRPDYKRYFYRRAPLERNQLIVDTADFVVAVWDGSSTGTKDAVLRAEKAGKPVRVYSPDGALPHSTRFPLLPKKRPKSVGAGLCSAQRHPPTIFHKSVGAHAHVESQNPRPMESSTGRGFTSL